MAKIKDVRIGTKIEIEMTDSLGGKIGRTYTSQLLDIIDEKHITIAAPIQESRLMLIPTGSSIRCVLLHHKHGMLAFMCSLTSKEKQGSLIVFNIEITSELYIIQRRNHFRLECTLDVRYRLVDEGEIYDEGTDTLEFKKAYTKDISGCGACLITDEEIEKGKYLYVVFHMDDTNIIEVKCLIIRCIKLDDAASKYSVGLSFNGLSKKDQEVFIKYIFDKQKQLLKRKVNI